MRGAADTVYPCGRIPWVLHGGYGSKSQYVVLVRCGPVFGEKIPKPRCLICHLSVTRVIHNTNSSVLDTGRRPESKFGGLL